MDSLGKREVHTDFKKLFCNCVNVCMKSKSKTAEFIFCDFERMSSCRHPSCPCFFVEAIPIPADQPIMQIKDLDEVVIPTMEIKVKIFHYS